VRDDVGGEHSLRIDAPTLHGFIATRPENELPAMPSVAVGPELELNERRVMEAGNRSLHRVTSYVLLALGSDR
jgi:hypothetical protein